MTLGQSVYPQLLFSAILLLCTVGAWISGQMVKLHDRVWEGGAHGGLVARLCRATARAGFDCAAVADEHWSVLRIPLLRPHRDSSVSLHVVTVPVAFIGLAYFITIGVWFAFAGAPHAMTGSWHTLIVGGALCGCVASLFFLALMALGRAVVSGLPCNPNREFSLGCGHLLPRRHRAGRDDPA